MNKFKLWISITGIILMIFILSTGCKIKQSTVETVKTSDTTIVTETLRDSLIVLAPYKAEIDGLWVYADTLGKINLPEVKTEENGFKLKAKIVNNKLTVSAERDTVFVNVYIKDKTIDKSHFVDKQSVKVIQKPYIPKVYQISFWVLIGIIVLGIVRAAFWVYKKFFI